MENTPTRGRPRKIEAEVMQAAIDIETPIPKEKRRRRSKMGLNSLKLGAPVREGYERRWVNDNGNRLAELEELGYDFVKDRDIQSSDLGSRISRHVGTKASGEPMRAYLMETPIELYAEGVVEKEAHHRQIDDAIAAGRDTTGQHQSDGYVGQGSIKQSR